MTRTHYALALTVVSLPVAAALQGCAGDAKANPARDTATPAIAVAVAAVTSDAVAQPVTVIGTWSSRDEVPLSFKIGGVIARVAVDQGAVVSKGQLLASLDLREIDAMVDKARVGVEKAERDAARVKRLAHDSVATLAQAQDAQSALDAARADYATAKVNREYAIITAPEGGVVLERKATAGTTIGAGMPVLTIGGATRGRVLRAGLSDRDAMRVQLGNSATVRFDAVPNVTYKGTVTLLGKAADPRTGTYTVEIQLADANALPNGLVGRADIAVKARNSAMYVPVDALLEADADSAVVYTVNEHAPYVATAHKVHIAQLAGDKAAITGLDASARVITRGAPYVTPGARVTVAPEPATLTASAVKDAQR